MKKTVSIAALALVMTAGSAFASGYRIPEQSVDSLAKAGANIASASGADSTYYNPANMAWMEDAWHLEGSLQYIHLPSVEYSDNRTSMLNGSSKEEDFILPTMFLVSPDYNNFRFGVSLTEPFGLAKRWEDEFPRIYAEKFSLQVFELNPTATWSHGGIFSLSAGIRMLYSKATVASQGTMPSGISLSRYMDGDTVEWGYNLAASVKPSEKMNISLTYRSNIDLDLDGDVVIGTNVGPTVMNMGGSVSIPAPAVFALSVAYDFTPVTIELSWDRTFWSEYETLDFSYPVPITNPVLYGAFDVPKAKEWDDVDAFRIGVSWDVNDVLNLMAGFAIDGNPVPDSNLGFDLPDSDAYVYSIGGKYQITKELEFGLGYLYNDKDSRTVSNGTVDGTFTEGGAHMFSAGVGYTF